MLSLLIECSETEILKIQDIDSAAFLTSTVAQLDSRDPPSINPEPGFSQTQVHNNQKQ